MKRYKIDADFEEIGGFWTLEKTSEVFTGTLSSKKGSIKLVGSPSFRELDLVSSRRGFQNLFENRELPTAQTIAGFTTAGRCTLLGAYSVHDAGVTDYPNAKEITAKQYGALRLLMGLHVNSSEEEVITASAFYPSKIHQWLPTPWSIEFASEKRLYSAPLEPLQVFRFSSTALRAEVVCQVLSAGSAKTKKGASILSVPRILVKPDTCQSLDWHNSIAYRLENFFTLLIGTSVGIKRVQLFKDDEEGWLVHKLRGPVDREKVDLGAWLRCPAEKLCEALAIWLAVPDDKRPVERTLLGVIRKSNMFDETVFLSLAQALEGFARIHFAPAKGTPYSALIEQTYDLLSPSFAIRLLGERSSTVRQVVDTRNYFTHLGIKRGKAVVDGTKDLFLFNQRLSAFLRCVMLIELSIPENQLEEPILHQATKWR